MPVKKSEHKRVVELIDPDFAVPKRKPNRNGYKYGVPRAALEVIKMLCMLTGVYINLETIGKAPLTEENIIYYWDKLRDKVQSKYIRRLRSIGTAIEVYNKYSKSDKIELKLEIISPTSSQKGADSVGRGCAPTPNPTSCHPVLETGSNQLQQEPIPPKDQQTPSETKNVIARSASDEAIYPAPTETEQPSPPTNPDNVIARSEEGK
jgi:hypothetical protein